MKEAKTKTKKKSFKKSMAFVAKERVDGKLILPEAVQILKMKGTAQG